MGFPLPIKTLSLFEFTPAAALRKRFSFQMSFCLSLSLLLALHTGLLVMLALANLGQYAGPGTLALKTLQSAFKGFVFPNADFRHCFPSPRANRDATSGTGEYSPLYRPPRHPVKQRQTALQKPNTASQWPSSTPNVLYLVSITQVSE